MEGESQLDGENREEGEKDYLEYEGSRNAQNDWDGPGRCLLSTGDYYEGMFKNGFRHGVGQYIFKDGARYLGYYYKNVKQGLGTFYYPDGSRYQGEWVNNIKQGYGRYEYTNGDYYEGQWRKDTREGVGTYYHSSMNALYVGMWIGGEQQGPVQIITQNHRYHGLWNMGMPTGSGCFTFRSKCMQHGYYLHMEGPEAEKENLEEDASSEEEEKAWISVWRAREVTPIIEKRFPKPPHPLDYPPSLFSMVSEEEILEGEVYKYDFFKEMAMFDQIYMDEKRLLQEDTWDQEVNDGKQLRKQLTRGVARNRLREEIRDYSNIQGSI